MVKITDYMSEDLIGRSEHITDKEQCYEAFIAREKLGSTGIGKMVAIPHAKTDIADKLVIGFGISKDGIDFDSLDEENAKIYFVFASPVEESQTYLKILARISRLIRDKGFRDKLYNAKTPQEVIEFINKAEQN